MVQYVVLLYTVIKVLKQVVDVCHDKRVGQAKWHLENFFHIYF